MCVWSNRLSMNIVIIMEGVLAKVDCQDTFFIPNGGIIFLEQPYIKLLRYPLWLMKIKKRVAHEKKQL